ncbi:MAG: TatD family hydrolase, partial [Cyanobacteria bacterium J06638_22]
KGYYPQDRSSFHLSLEQRVLFRLWEQRNRTTVTPLEEMTVQPPSVEACLLHPKVLACIIANLSEEAANAVARSKFMPPDESPRHMPLIPHTVDAHIHIDRLGIEFEAKLGSIDDCRIQYQALIANFAHPARWNLWEQLEQHPHLHAAFGIHPVVCGQQPGVILRLKAELERRLSSPRCVALGEIGLDYFRCTMPKQQLEQRQTLRSMLKLRPGHLPVVVHCRGEGAREDCLHILKQCLGRSTVIQLHCFLGGRNEVQEWQEAFPGCFFSLSHKSLALEGSGAEEHGLAIRGLSLDRILIESDAPYLGRTARVMRMAPGPASPRRDLHQIAEWVGHMKGLCPSAVLEAAGHNALRAFRLPRM